MPVTTDFKAHVFVHRESLASFVVRHTEVQVEPLQHYVLVKIALLCSCIVNTTVSCFDSYEGQALHSFLITMC